MVSQTLSSLLDCRHTSTKFTANLVGTDVRVGEGQYDACIILITVEYGVTRPADSELRAAKFVRLRIVKTCRS